MLKKLTIVSLLLLILPFFQTCSDKNLMENTLLKNSPISEQIKPIETHFLNGKEINTNRNVKEFHYSYDELKEKKQETIKQFLWLKKDMTKNGYQLGFSFVKQLELKDLLNTIDYGLLPFFLILIITVLLIFFTFKKNLKIIIVLAVLNLLLLIGQLVLTYKTEFLEDIEQIKYGYYLFLLNLVLIIVEAINQQKKKKNERTTAVLI